MLVQMPLSHMSPASHSSTSAGHGGVRGPGWGGLRLLPFSHGCPWPGALELRPVELERIMGTSPYSHVHITRGNQATCCQGPWACLIPNSLGLLILHPSSPDKRCPPPASPALPWASLPQLLPLWFSPFSPTWLPSFPHK